MTTLKQGDLIKDQYGNKREVLGVCGKVLHIESLIDKTVPCFATTEAHLKHIGYTWDTPAWEPEFDEKYWYPDTNGDIYSCTWGNTVTDNGRKNLLGIYKTFTLAEAALLEIRRKLGK